MTDDELVAETVLGRLRGVRHEGVVQFRGVPYARPPVGALRFRPPEPHPGWAGEREATRHGPIAPQAPSRLRRATGHTERPQSEDCLTLTISTPSVDRRARPVLVWLHGGAYLTGAGSLDWYDGARLAREGDLVVVGVNYRLGAFGQLRRPGLSDGSQSFEDVRAALGWVQATIASFGGDPDRVTVMGQSAGGGMIAYLLARGDAPRLFRRAIMQSAHLGIPPYSAAQGEERGERLVRLLGLDARSAAEIDVQLRDLPAVSLVEAVAALAREAARPDDIAPPLLPVLDDLSTEDALLDRVAEGAAAVDLLIGSARDEVLAFSPDPALTPLTDRVFRTPGLRLATAVSTARAYQFDWAPSASPLGACHCIELPFVFGTAGTWKAPMLEGSDPVETAALIRLVQAAWIAFVRTGDPSAGGPCWPAFGAGGVVRHLGS